MWNKGYHDSVEVEEGNSVTNMWYKSVGTKKQN